MGIFSGQKNKNIYSSGGGGFPSNFWFCGTVRSSFSEIPFSSPLIWWGKVLQKAKHLFKSPGHDYCVFKKRIHLCTLTTRDRSFFKILFKLGTEVHVVIAWASLLAKRIQTYLPWGVFPQKFGVWGLERSNFSEIPSSSPLIW